MVELFAVKLKLILNVYVGEIASYNKMEIKNACFGCFVSPLIFSRYWKAPTTKILVPVPILPPSVANIDQNSPIQLITLRKWYCKPAICNCGNYVKTLKIEFRFGSFRKKALGDCFQILLLILSHFEQINPFSHFQPVFHFYTPWKHQKTRGFLVFSGGYRSGTLVENELIRFYPLWNRQKII